MFYSSSLKKFPNIKHCFFSRRNGVSKGFYKSLNCGQGSKDKKEDVLKNLKIVCEIIGCENESLITLNQVHSNKVIYFENKTSVQNKLSGDAIVSKVKNTAIGILTADCVPILFYDPVKKIIGCVHSGWKGAFNGVIKNTIKKFNDLNSKNSDLIAVVGPCIDKKNYEVKNDFYNKFISKEEKNKKFFHKKNNEKYIFDLREYVNNEILNLNVKNIENIDLDTFSRSELFYSYRRSCLNKEKDYGRCISVILMT
jgi:YfiH family protein